MDATSEINQISHVIQLSVAPVFLLTGVGAMLNVLSNRLSRTVDRARAFEARYATAGTAEQDLLRFQLKLQARRCRLIYAAMALCVVCALLICSVIVALFASSFFATGLALLIASRSSQPCWPSSQPLFFSCARFISQPATCGSNRQRHKVPAPSRHLSHRRHFDMCRSIKTLNTVSQRPPPQYKEATCDQPEPKPCRRRVLGNQPG
jgi:hypothetical protein